MILMMTMVMTIMMIMVMILMMTMVMMMSMTTMRTSEVKLPNPKSFFEGVHLQHRVETVAASKAAA